MTKIGATENCQSPERPIYLMGWAFGTCLVLSIVTHNPEIDNLLVLSNSGVCMFQLMNKLFFPPLTYSINNAAMPKKIGANLHDMLNLIRCIESNLLKAIES